MNRAGRAGRALITLLAAAVVASGIVTVEPALRPVPDAGAATANVDEIVRIAVDDLQSWWRDEFPSLYGDRYVPVPANRVIAGGPGVKLPTCQGQRLGYRDVEGNAFYCYRDNFVAYDAAGLFPQLARDVGPFAVSMVLAHEWGHAVQDRAGEIDHATIGKELQADCFAGAWTAHVTNDRTKVAFAPGDLEVALVAMIGFRDAPGSSPDDPSAHGSAFDRVSAFQDGFQRGGARCAAYFDDPPVVVQIPFTNAADAAQQGNVPAEDVVPLTVDLLNDFYSQVEPAYTPLSTDDVVAYDSAKRSTVPRCGGTKPSTSAVRNRVFYCIDDGYVAFDQPFLQDVYDNIGDFGVTTLLANPWATRVQMIQKQPGVAQNTLEVVMQADCYTGGWAAAFYNGYLSAGSLSPGDLDEFVQAFLEYSRARGVSAKVPITFVRVGFFRQGFFNGYQSCGYTDIAREVAAIR